MKTIDVQALALKAGLLVEEVEGSGETYWTDGNYISALENFASLVLKEPDISPDPKGYTWVGN
jgi:hypothetical protein